MTQLVCSTSYRGLGCTFIDWSIHFLSGATEYFSVAKNKTIPLVNNPLTSTNAHGHQKNHPLGQQQTDAYIKILQTSNLPLNSFYPCSMTFYQATQDLNLAHANLENSSVTNSIIDYIHSDYKKIFTECHNRSIKLIYVDLDPQLSLYLLNQRGVNHLLTKDSTASNINESAEEFTNLFFSKSVETWKSAGLTEIWDVRERLALNLRPFNYTPPQPDFSVGHFWLNAVDLWTRGEIIIKDLMRYCNLNIVPTRFDYWLSVYQQWSAIQRNELEFAYNYKHIVKSIINGWNYQIDLSFLQEAVIQHCLIYQHGMNLKTWLLEKFPSNTKDLHLLLEPNIHTVESIY